MENCKMILVITFLLGLFFAAGAAAARLSDNTRKIEEISISVAAGAMSALAAADIIPEILHEMSGTGLIKAVLFTAAGIVFLKLLDRFVPEHHGDEESPGAMIHIGIISALAIMLHNIIEGMAVYELGADSLRQGVIFAIGVGLHNIPMGMLVYSTLKDETRVKKYTVLFAVMISTFAGGLVMAALGSCMSHTLIDLLTCLTLGMIMYIISSELVPYMAAHRNYRVYAAGIAAGAAIVAVSLLFE